MIRIPLFFMLLALAAAVSGCENVVPATDLPYVNHIVIRGFLKAGEPIDSISVSHTLPLSAPYDPNQAAIPNALVSITVDGRSIPLQPLNFGFFTDPAHDTVQSGKTYMIDVQWNGLHAWASTLVPKAPQVQFMQLDSIRWDTSIDHYNQFYIDTFISLGGILDIGIQAAANEAYVMGSDSIAGLDSGGFSVESGNYYDYFNYHLSTEANSDGILRLLERQTLDQRDSNYFVSATIENFDQAYYNFLKTYNSYNDNSDPFGTGGANPQWNVSGDGIGIFIGTAETRRSSTFHR